MSLGGFQNILYFGLVFCGLASIIVLISVVFTVFFLDRQIRTCPECRHRSTGYITHTEEIESSTHIDYRGGRGVRVKKEHFVDHYKCEFCGHQWTRAVKRTDRTPHNPLPSGK